MNKILKIVLFLFLLLPCLILAADKLQIAVIDLTPKDVSASLASTVTDFLRNDFFNTGKYVVLERGNIDKILKEQSFQKSGCTTTECAIELGKILNVQQMVVGSLSKVGYKYYIIVRMIDVESVKTVVSVTEECYSENDLADTCKYIAKKMSGENVTRETVKEDRRREEVKAVKNAPPRVSDVVTSYDVAWRSLIIPGWGQIENGQDLKGYAILIGELGFLTGTVLTYLDHERAVTDYNNGTTGSDFDALAKKEEDTRNLNTICFWGAVGFWVYGVIDPYIFEPNTGKKPKVELQYKNEEIKLSYVIRF